MVDGDINTFRWLDLTAEVEKVSVLAHGQVKGEAGGVTHVGRQGIAQKDDPSWNGYAR